MIGLIERNEGFRVFGGLENAPGVVDADGLVERPVKDQQRLFHGPDLVLEGLAGNVFEELLLDREAASGQGHFRDAVLFDALQIAPEVVLHMVRIGRRPDGADALDTVHGAGRRQHGGATEAVADQDRRRLMVFAKPVCGGDQVVDVGTEVGVGELAVAMAEPREIKPEDADAVLDEAGGDPLGGKDVLRAGETVGE